jgi:peptidoglycan/LPS O-acetylase OafA/YrhL
VKRAALLILVVGAPLVLLFFPELRRRIAHKLRFLLLLWSGAVLFFGLLGAPGRKSFLEGEWNEGAVWPLLGMALFVAAFVSVLRDFRLSSPSQKGAKRR